MSEKLNLDLYRCECGHKFKKFGKRSLNQYICSKCGLFVPEEKLYKYKKD